MIHLFANARRFLLCAGGVTPAAALAVLLLQKDPVGAVLLLAVGGWVSWFGAQYIAITTHQRMLAILYNRMEPGLFLEQYLPLLSRTRAGSPIEAAVRAHAGNAYAAKGDFKAALDYFASTCDRLDTRIMQAQNRCSCLLWMRDGPAAERELALLDELLALQKNKYRLAEGQSARALLQIRLRLLGGAAGREAVARLRAETTGTNKPLHRSAMRLELARIYAAQGQEELARNLLQNIVDDGGSTWWRSQAQEMLSE